MDSGRTASSMALASTAPREAHDMGLSLDGTCDVSAKMCEAVKVTSAEVSGKKAGQLGSDDRGLKLRHCEGRRTCWLGPAEPQKPENDSQT